MKTIMDCLQYEQLRSFDWFKMASRRISRAFVQRRINRFDLTCYWSFHGNLIQEIDDMFTLKTFRKTKNKVNEYTKGMQDKENIQKE